MKLTSILIVSGGGFQGHALIKALRAVPGIRILVADSYSENVSRYFSDGFFLAPLLEHTQLFLNFLTGLCEQEEVEAIFASTSFELNLLSSRKAEFMTKGITIYVSDAALLDIANDKLLFYRWLNNECLPCQPCYATPHDEGVIFPLIGKPRNGWGGKGVCVLENQAAVKGFTAGKLEDYAWQPCLQDFEEYSVDFAIDVMGNISPLAFRRRIRTLGGLAILCEPGAPEFVRDLARCTIERLIPLGALGPMNLQILRQDDACWVSDLNPRVGTSMPLDLVTAHNPISFLFVHEKSEESAPDSGTCFRTLRYLEERCIPSLELEDVHGVVFDLDDTLLDQKEWIFSKLELLWEYERTSLPSSVEFLSMALRILEEGNRAHLIDAICQELRLDNDTRVRMIEAYRNVKPDSCKLYEDVFPTLDQLRRMGYKLALVTDNPVASQQQKLMVCRIKHLFDVVLLTGELGMQKPDSRVFDEISQRIGFAAEQLIMVGDNLFRDIQGALFAGYKHGFHIQRPGAFFNFNMSLAQRVIEKSPAITSIESLNEITWHFKAINNR